MFVENLPLLVGDRIKDPADDQVWKLCLMLRNIVELICAPKTSFDQIGYLKFLIEEYIDLRTSIFPDKPVKPKHHHYLLHYPDLIIRFGPLIRLWTLRFESKHTSFKQCARKLHNFKNLCSTLAERHQLYQSYLIAGSLFQPTLQIVGKANDFEMVLYNEGIQSAMRLNGFSQENTIETSSVNYKGTLYWKGLTLIVDQNVCGFVFGRIVLMLIHQSKLHFIVELCQSIPLMDLGVHCLQFNADSQYTSISAECLSDYYPLPEYKRFGLSLIPLHHSVYLGES